MIDVVILIFAAMALFCVILTIHEAIACKIEARRYLKFTNSDSAKAKLDELALLKGRRASILDYRVETEHKIYEIKETLEYSPRNKREPLLERLDELFAEYQSIKDAQSAVLKAIKELESEIEQDYIDWKKHRRYKNNLECSSSVDDKEKITAYNKSIEFDSTEFHRELILENEEA